MNHEEYTQFAAMAAQLYDQASLPTALVDDALQLLWCNRAAREVHPSFQTPDGLRVILPAGFADVFLDAVAKGGTPPTDFPLPMTGRTITLLPTSVSGLFLLHSTLEEPTGTALCPEGPQRLLTTFSNQFRAPLSAIFSTLSALRANEEWENSPALSHYVQSINTACYKMLRGYLDITDYIRQQTGTMTVNADSVDLRDFLENLCEALRIATGSVDIPLTWELPKQPVVVRCDQQLLSLALLQLLANSCRFTRPGNAIHLSLKETENSVLLTVRDRGLGIPSELLAKVCDPYFSYDHFGEPAAGFGLGLTLAKYAVTAQGGTMALQSEEDEGTTVTFTLPKATGGETLRSPVTPAQYLYDRFSPVYVYLCDSIEPPKP